MMTSLISDTDSIKTKLDQLTTQISTGLVSNTYAGLGAGAAVSLDLNPQIATLQTWQNNINAATGTMGVSQTAMTQIQQIASDFLAQTSNLEGADSSEVDTIAASAQQALVQVAELLDTQDGNTYVFAGQDTTNPPVPDPDSILSSGFYTQIAAQVDALGTQGAAATIANTLSIAGSDTTGTSPFSAYLSQTDASDPNAPQAPTIQVGQGQTATVGLLASANSFVTSQGSSTTGSYMRDLMRALATMGSMSSTQVSDSGYRYAGAGHQRQPDRRHQRHGGRRGCAGQHPDRAHRQPDHHGRHRHRADHTGRQCAGRGRGAGHEQPVAGADPVDRLLPGDRRR